MQKSIKLLGMSIHSSNYSTEVFLVNLSIFGTFKKIHSYTLSNSTMSNKPEVSQDLLQQIKNLRKDDVLRLDKFQPLRN